MRVGLFDDPIYREHHAGPGHPERPERLAAVEQALSLPDLHGELLDRSPRPVSREELLAVHVAGMVERVADTEGHGGQLDADTGASPRSYAAALRAAGAVAGAVDEILDGTLDRAFCAVRPPGHHATRQRSMGFCLFNNVAVGAAHALSRGLDRVAVLDFDVHHGNGTQDIFWEDPRVLFVSSHQFPFYPGTGAVDEVGEGDGRGFTVNLPMPGGLGDGEYARAWREIVEPIGRAFDPQLVLISAGFDAHEDDPLGGMALSAAGYAELADVCVGMADGAAKGRVVAVLEGGYSLEGLGEGSGALGARLLGRSAARVQPAEDARSAALVEVYREAQGAFWPVLGG